MRGFVRKRGTTWSYVFEVGKLDGQRKKKEKGGFKTKKDAQLALRKAIDEFENGAVPVEDHKMSVADYMTYWLDNHVKINLKYRTYERYKSDINKHVRPALGHYHLQKLSHTTLQIFFTQKIEKGFSKNSVNNLHGVISSALKMAYKWGFIKANPMQKVSSPKQSDKKDIVVLQSKELNQIIERIKNGNFYVPFMIALNTGMRAAEVTGLEWSDINFETRSIQVTKILQNQNGTWVFSTPKTKSSVRNILMTDTLYKILKQQKTKQKENQLLYGEHYHESNFVSTKQNGEPITTDSLKYLSRVINNNLKIPFKFHYLRHTHATMMLEQGIHPKVVQERLGHSKISTTLDTYSHVSMNMQKQAIDIFDEALKKTLPK